MKERKNKSLSRKIAAEVIKTLDLDEWDEETLTFVVDPATEKQLAKVIKRVIRRHDAGK